MTRTVDLHLPDARSLFVFDEAAFDPFDPQALDGPGVDQLLAVLTGQRLWAPPPPVRVHVPPGRCAEASPDRLRQGLVLYAERRMAHLRGEQREFVVSSLFFAGIALVVVVAALSLGARMTLHQIPADESLRSTLMTGLDVLVWVALWVPLAALIQDWYPFAQERRALSMLTRLPLTVVCDGAGRPSPGF